MGNMVDGSGNYYQSSSGLTKLDVKYFDSYAYSASNYLDHARGKLGDATKETLKSYGLTSRGWYGNGACFPYSTNAFFHRGGTYNEGTTTGVFNFFNGPGSAYTGPSFRVVLTAQ